METWNRYADLDVLAMQFYFSESKFVTSIRVANSGSRPPAIKILTRGCRKVGHTTPHRTVSQPSPRPESQRDGTWIG